MSYIEPLRAFESISTLEGVEVGSKTYMLDFDKKKLTSKVIDGEEAVKQSIYIILSIERGKAPGFPADFGVELEGLFGMPRNFVKANLERVISEALRYDPRISYTDNYLIEDAGDHGGAVTFDVHLRDNTDFEMEVVLNV